MAYIVVAIIRVNEAEGWWDLICRSCRGSKHRVVEHGIIQWERAMKKEIREKMEMLFLYPSCYEKICTDA
jgi:hypothetical protein